MIKLAAHSTTSPTPTAMRQSFIMTPYYYSGMKNTEKFVVALLQIIDK
jgi:hypothetical protein